MFFFKVVRVIRTPGYKDVRFARSCFAVNYQRDTEWLNFSFFFFWKLDDNHEHETSYSYPQSNENIVKAWSKMFSPNIFILPRTCDTTRSPSFYF